MCGRFIIKRPWSEIHRLYQLTLDPGFNLRERYNVAPTQTVLTIRSDAEKHRTAAELRWGLIPFWAKDAKIGYSLINAMSETVADKPSFREAFRLRRCIIPADGFYEWKKLDAKTKQPYAIVPARDDEMFSFAGLWERWKDKASGDTIESCTIITTEPNAVCAPIHNRMPVILPETAWARWLGEEKAERDELLSLLKPYDAKRMRAYPVGVAVGNVKNQGPELMAPVAA